LIWNYPGIPVYATNFRIIPFPKWKFFSGKNGNPIYKSTGWIQISFLVVYKSTGGIQISFLVVYMSTGGIQISFLGV